MDFWLHYRGQLKPNGSKEHKYELRKAFHNQIKELWEYEPLKSFPVKEDGHVTKEMIKQVGDYKFATLIIKGKKGKKGKELGLYAGLDITMLRAESPGRIIHHGDLDNRLKTLFDALRCPQTKDEIPLGETPTKDYLYCLLEDDCLIMKENVLTDRLLDCKDPEEVLLLIHVTLMSKGRKPIWLLDWL